MELTGQQSTRQADRLDIGYMNPAEALEAAGLSE
jgi:hypothetical protein